MEADYAVGADAVWKVFVLVWCWWKGGWGGRRNGGGGGKCGNGGVGLLEYERLGEEGDAGDARNG